MNKPTGETDIAAECFGVKVPASQFLHEKRIERINAGRYEGQEIEGALHVVSSDDVVLEIGAGIGVVGAVIATNAKPKTVQSFEANPNLIPVIRDLYRVNDLEDRISVRNAVLLTGDDQPATVPFHVKSSYLGSSLVDDGRAREVVQIETADLATVCAELQPSVLIMDIEGGELDLLKGADLSGFRAAVLEFHPKVYGVEGMRLCKSLLQDAGFVRVAEKSTRTVWTCVRP